MASFLALIVKQKIKAAGQIVNLLCDNRQTAMNQNGG
jgi:hypothetical protein